VDVYASDACYMAMIEVANELAGSVEIVAGSEDGEPAEGWPYKQLMEEWQMETALTSRRLVEILVHEYIRFHAQRTGGLESDTYSAYDMQYIGELNRAIAVVGKDIVTLKSSKFKRVLQAAFRTTRFDYGDYLDLGDFMQLLRAKKVIPSEDIAAVIAASKKFVFVNDVSKDYKNKAFGVSIWVPLHKSYFERYFERYKKLRFAIRTEWNTVVDQVHKHLKMYN
jgi:hypothetical protein